MVYLPNILQGSCLAAIGLPSARVDVNWLVYVLYVCKESAVAEHVHCAMVVEKDSICNVASRIVVNVVRYLVKARAWHGLGVLVVFVVRLVVVFCFSVTLVCFMVEVHASYACCHAIDSLHDVVWAASYIPQFFLFVLFEGA